MPFSPISVTCAEVSGIVDSGRILLWTLTIITVVLYMSRALTKIGHPSVTSLRAWRLRVSIFFVQLLVHGGLDLDDDQKKAVTSDILVMLVCIYPALSCSRDLRDLILYIYVYICIYIYIRVWISGSMALIESLVGLTSRRA